MSEVRYMGGPDNEFSCLLSLLGLLVSFFLMKAFHFPVVQNLSWWWVVGPLCIPVVIALILEIIYRIFK